MNVIDGSRKYIFVINPRSFNYDRRKIDEFIASVNSIFKKITTERNSYDFSVYESKFPRYAVSILPQIIKNTPPEKIIRIFAVGGDGILFDCLNGIVGFKNCELGNIPYGITNHFLASFGYKKVKHFLNIEEQLSAPAIMTDIIDCGTNYAINMVLLGLEAKSTFFVHRIIELNRNIFDRFPKLSRLAFILSGLICIFIKDIREHIYKIEFEDGQIIEDKFVTVNIANGSRYSGGNRSAQPEALANDGILNALFARSIPPLKGISIISDYVKGKWKKHEKYFVHKMLKGVKISSDTPIFINLDGELFRDLNIELKIIPGAVRFVAVDNLTFLREEI
jgi:diacylglycerol kinase family enzyme